MEVSNEHTQYHQEQRKASATHDAQIHLTRYRGIDCNVHQGGKSPTVHTAIAVVRTPSKCLM